MKYFVLTLSVLLSSIIIKAQEPCNFLETVLIDQSSNQVILGSNESNPNLIYSWVYFNEDGSCIGGDEGIYDTISDLNQEEFLIIWQMIAIDTINCITQDTLLFDDNQWMLLDAQMNEGGQGCTDSTGTNYEVGSEMFLNDCEYIFCQENSEWSDVMVIDDCLIIDCIAGACVDVSLFGQIGTFLTEEDCQLECGQELPFECIAGNCIDVAQFGQEGSYGSEKQCLEDCQEIETDPSFECIAGFCVDVDQFGQEGSFDSSEECEKACQTNEESSYECIADMCVDVGQIGQEGSYSNLEDCQIICEGLPANINEHSSGILIAPNPFNSYTQIYSKEQVTQYSLLDIKGRKIISKTVNSKNFIVDKNDLRTGIYYLELISKNRHSFHKLIVE